MNRRTFLSVLTGSLFAAPLAAEAQLAPKVYRIGYLSDLGCSDDPFLRDPFRRGPVTDLSTDLPSTMAGEPGTRRGEASFRQLRARIARTAARRCEAGGRTTSLQQALRAGT